MTLRDLLDHFTGFESIPDIRGTPEFLDISERLPTEPSSYVTIVRDYLSSLGGDLPRLYEEFLETTERLEDVLRELYFLDYRTFEALLEECEFALNNSDSEVGMTALAAILSKLPPKGFRLDDEQLLRRVETYLVSPAMRHNARGIRQKLVRRSPYLTMSQDLYPSE